MAFLYTNEKGEQVIKNDCPLNSGESGQYTVFHHDGSSDYYDRHGKLLEHRPAPEKTELQKQIEELQKIPIEIKTVSIEEFMDKLKNKLEKQTNEKQPSIS